MSGTCAFCGRDPDTGETYCVRFREWVPRCPKREGREPWEAERLDADGEGDE